MLKDRLEDEEDRKNISLPCFRPPPPSKKKHKQTTKYDKKTVDVTDLEEEKMVLIWTLLSYR